MQAIDILNEEIPPLLHTDTGEKVLHWMDEFKVSHLPVLKNGNFVGLVSESAVLDAMDLTQDLDKMFLHLPRPYVNTQSHVYDILLKMSNEKLSVLPVLNEKEEYVGCISVYTIMSVLSDFGSLKEPGGILVLEVNSIDYSLAQIAQIVESNNAKILSTYITSSSTSLKIEITIKINDTNLTRIIRTFERFDYVVKAAYQDENEDENMRLRFDAMINFMKI